MGRALVKNFLPLAHLPISFPEAESQTFDGRLGLYYRFMKRYKNVTESKIFCPRQRILHIAYCLREPDG